MRVRSAKQAFTLIELLVVISIIALLIGILLPSLGAARQQAWLARCQSNMHQLGIGYAAYLTNESSYLPLTGNTGNAENYGYWNQGWSYSQWHLWLPYATYWDTSMYTGYAAGSSVPPPPPLPVTTSTAAGMGMIFQFIAAESPSAPTAGSNGAGKLFYCPGTPASFDKGPAFGDQYDGAWSVWPGRAWYETFTYGFGTPPSMSDPRKGGAQSTYMYRNGDYYAERWPTTTATWYQSNLRGEDPRVFDKAMLTCFGPCGWGYPGQGGWPGWMGALSAGPATGAWAAHGGGKTNLLWTDGSARSYRPGNENGQSFAWGVHAFGAMSAPSQATYLTMGNCGSGAAYGQLPWFWVMADQGR